MPHAAGTGSDGGITQVARVADLAKQLGFRVIGVIDHDKPGPQTAAELAAVESASDVVIRLPSKMAIEAAITSSYSAEALRLASAALTVYGMPDPVASIPDNTKALKALAKALHSHGLHEQILTTLIADHGLPQVVEAALDAVALAAGHDYSGPPLVTIPEPTIDSAA